MPKRLSFYLAVGGIIAVTLLVLRLRQSGPTPEPLVPPPQSPYADSIGGRGLVESVNENVRIAPATSGLIREVMVKVGDKISKGDVLFAMDDRDALSQVKVQQAQVAVLEAQVATAQTIVADRKDQLDRSIRLREKMSPAKTKPSATSSPGRRPTANCKARSRISTSPAPVSPTPASASTCSPFALHATARSSKSISDPVNTRW